MIEPVELHDKVHFLNTLRGQDCVMREVSGGAGWSGSHALIADQGDYGLECTGLGFHLFEVCLGGNHRGRNDIEGICTPTDCTYEQGALYYVPNGRRATIAFEGRCRNLQLLISKDVMQEAKSQVFAGDPDKVDLLAFNDVYDGILRQAAVALYRSLLAAAGGNAVAADDATLQFCVVLLAGMPYGEKHATRRRTSLSAHELERARAALSTESIAQEGLKAVADAAGLSPSRLSHGFRDATGQSPHQFLMDLRIARACQMIEDSDAPLVQVALDCGFASQSHMTDVFRQKLGISPSRYRSVFAD